MSPAATGTRSNPASKGRPATRRAVPTPSRKKAPSLLHERALWDGGAHVVVGLDEVGRGAWAGPLAIGAAVLPRDRRVNRVRDSKMLTEATRERLFDRLADWCAAWSVGMVTHEECDAMGMSAAQKLAARRAIEGLGRAPDHVLIDGNWDFVGEVVGAQRVTKIVKGDATCLSISTASVLAKVSRDRLMRAEDDHFPGYEFASNKGYPCPRHKMSLAAWGPTAIHRRSWAFMDGLPWSLPRLTPGGQTSLF